MFQQDWLMRTLAEFFVLLDKDNSGQEDEKYRGFENYFASDLNKKHKGGPRKRF